MISLDELIAHAAYALPGDGILQVGGVVIKVKDVRRDVTRRLDVDGPLLREADLAIVVH
jgi:hypothetical protein